MKRFWLVMLSLGLVLAFSASAMAVDVKFSGSFYAAGMYLDKTNLVSAEMGTNPSTAFYYQRLRVQSDFIVSPGLKLVTRFDALERIWGGARSATTTTAADSAAYRLENENIAFDWAYINYVSPIGTFDVGYMNYGATGTIFGNNSKPVGRIKYSYAIGSATINAAISKVNDNSSSAIAAKTTTDEDNDVYHLEGVYTWKEGKAGINVNYYRSASTRPAINNYKTTYFLFTPYAIAKIGPVAIQAEFNWATGNAVEYDNGSFGNDIKMQNLSGWVDATADFSKFYFGGTFAYVSGDDDGTADRREGGNLNGGIDWNPCLIMFNQERTYWAGNLAGYDTATNASPMSNAWFYQGKIGVRPVAALDIVASLAYAVADKPNTIMQRKYGWELDVTGTYKITNNLSYMLGAGYWWVGDYYKGTSDYNRDLTNNYMLINKLTLTF